MGDIKNFIAARVAKELKDGDVVNLGIGLPTLVPNHLPEGVDLTLQSENGFVGLVPLEEGKESPHVVNAGGVMAGIADDGAFFSSADSFAIIRGGHVDVTVLGSLPVDEKGNIANYKIPGKMLPGMGGAMDLVVGARKVIVAMESCNKKGEPVGYGGIWTSPKDTKIGVVAIGYGDGYPRDVPEGTPVYLNGRIVPIVGRVSMDMLTVDLGADSQDKVGDEVILWGKELPIETVAKYSGILSYELITKLTPRVITEYVD